MSVYPCEHLVHPLVHRRLGGEVSSALRESSTEPLRGRVRRGLAVLARSAALALCLTAAGVATGPATASAAEEDSGGELMSVIEAYYPESWARLVAAKTELEAGRISVPDFRTTATLELKRLHADALPKADMDTLTQAFDEARRQLVELRMKSEAECDAFAMNGATNTPISELLGPEPARRANRMLARILAQAMVQPAHLDIAVTDAEVTDALQTAAAEVARGFPVDQRRAVVDGLMAGKPPHACAWLLAFFDALAAMPPDRRAAMYQRFQILKSSSQ